MTSTKDTGSMLDRLMGCVQTPKETVSRPQASAPVENKMPVPQTHPILSGRLAAHLANQEQRDIDAVSSPFLSDTPDWRADSPEIKAAAAIAMTLACHIVHYAHSIMSESVLERARDELLQCFGPHDKVRIEVEAYDLLNWFAGAMNETWQMRATPSSDAAEEDSGRDILEAVLQKAIELHRDLVMRYYTGSRGEFTERRITPIEITAEKFLIAFCHLRQGERVFRLSRIVRLEPTEPHAPDDGDFRFPRLDSIKTPVKTNENLNSGHQKDLFAEDKPTKSKHKNMSDSPKQGSLF